MGDERLFLRSRARILACATYAGMQFFSVAFWPQHCSGKERPEVAATNDYLQPVDVEETKVYRLRLEALLFVTTADCGRMLVRPSETPEVSVAVYSQNVTDSKRKYTVTVTKASESVWYALEDRKPSAHLNVVRCDAEIGSATALAVKNIWRRRLFDLRNPRANPLGPSIDGEIIEFSMKSEGQRDLVGELPSHPSKRLLTLETVGRLLIEYCKANPNSRALIAARIEKIARQK